MPALNSAGVTESLPQLQRVELGPLTMGYADLFLPALVGALLATQVRTRRWVALLTSLPEAEFAKAFTHPEWGRVRLDEAVALYAWHSRHHAAHIEIVDFRLQMAD